MMDNVCRTCLRTPNKLLPLRVDDSILHKIECISSIQLVFNEYYPSSICEECIDNVNKFFCFQKVITSNDRDLQQRYDTLKKTNYISKPRSKVKEPDEEDYEVKEELDLEDDDRDDDNLKIAEDIFDAIDNIQAENSTDDKTVPNGLQVENIKKAIAKLSQIKCDECNLTFPSRVKLYNHKRTCHTAPGICNICGLVVRADNLNRHVQMHSEEPVTCKICKKVFKNPESLRGHSLIHKGLVFTCEYCGKTSRVKSEHHRHLKTHTDPSARKVMCTLCGKCVRDLKRHMQSHTGERPYICNYCKKGFTSPYALKIHTRQHTNERPYICEYCSMAFPQKVSLTTHLKSKHDVIFT